MKITVTSLFLALFFVLGCASTPEKPAAQPGWKMLGPGGAGSMYFPTINPRDPDHCFVRCDMTGSYVTRDGGRSWHMFSLRSTADDFEFDPVDPEVVYASSTGLYRSDNGGYNWTLIYPPEDDVIAERMVGDHAEQYFETRSGLPDTPVQLVHVDPGDNSSIFFTLRARPGGNSIRLFHSGDRGKTFSQLAEIAGSTARAIFPGRWNGEPDRVYLITDSKLAAIDIASGKIEDFALPVENVRTSEGGFSPEDNSSAIYLATYEVRKDGPGFDGGVYRSRDFGRSWVQINHGLLGSRPDATAEQARFMWVACCESQPEVVYLSCNSWMNELADGSLEWRFGTLKSTDGGDNWDWKYLATNDSVLTNNYDGYWKDWYYGPGWSEAPKCIGVSPTDPDEVYITDVRVVRSRDGGDTWRQVSSDVHLPDSSSSIRGISGTTCYGVHFDPFDKQHIAISYTDVGLFQSFNRGETWVHGTGGIPHSMRNTIYWLVFDPEIRDKVYGVWSGCHDLPRPKMFRNGSIEGGRQSGAFAVSTDGARNWRVIDNGIPLSAVPTDITLDTTTPKEARTLYVCAMKLGVYKSTDSGESWELKNNGLPEQPCAWRTTLLPDGTLYLILVRDHTRGLHIDGGLYRSTDGAGSWEQMPLPEGYSMPNELSYDPKDPRTLYLACWPEPEDGHERHGGLLQSTDGGATWKQIFIEGAHVYMCAVDPANSNTLIINTFNNAALRSDDRGRTWKQLGGYDFKWGHRVIFDENDPSMIYLSTFGGNVYYGPATGVPDAKPTILNLPKMGW